MKCKNCNAENSNDAKFCNACGKPIDLTCQNCNTPHERDSKYCSNCGKPLFQNAPQPVNALKTSSLPLQIKLTLGFGVAACMLIIYILYSSFLADYNYEWDAFQSYVLLNMFMCLLEAVILISLFVKFQLKKQCFSLFVPYVLWFLYVLLWLSPSERDYINEGLYIAPSFLTFFVVLIFISFFTKRKGEESWWSQLD